MFQEGGKMVSRRLLEQGKVAGSSLAAAQRQHNGQLLQLRLEPAAKFGPPVVSLSLMY